MILVSILTILFLYLVLPWFYGIWLRYSLCRNAMRCNSVGITFDDGPGRDITPMILEILRTYQIRATFFLLGRNIAGKESIVRQIVAEGHEVGSHGFDHLHAWKVMPWCYISDIKKGWQAIDRALGTNRGVYPYRPPNGKMNLASLFYLFWKRIPIVFWTIDSGDTWKSDKRDPGRISEWIHKHKGGVVLLHDFDRVSEKNKQYLLCVLNILVEEVRKAELRSCTVMELMR